MGEHRLRPSTLGAKLKARWENSKAVDTHHRFVWRSGEKGTFQYPKHLYGPMTRRQYKNARKFLKKTLNGHERHEVMRNLIGRDDL